MQTVVLVEGNSDRVAVETLAGLRQQELSGIEIIELGGVTNAGKALAHYGPTGLGLRVSGLCDAGEERFFRGGLERAGFGPILSRDVMQRLGFFVCVNDLEDELIRALGTEGVEHVLDAEGDLQGFRVFQNQPYQRDRSHEQQLHRFFGTTAGRKTQYARALVSALERSRVPEPLELLLDFVAQAA